MERTDFIEHKVLVLLEQGNTQEALNLLEESSARSPGNSLLLLRLAELYSRLGDHQSALANYRRLSALLPEDREIMMMLGVEFAETGNYGEAIDSFLKCINSGPPNAVLHQMVGIACDELGRHDEALQHFSTACELDPDNDSSLTHLAKNLIHKLKLQEAEAHLRKALSINPANALAHNSLGRLYKLQGKATDAATAFRKALELEPGNPVVVNNLLLCMNYLANFSPENVFSEHKSLCERVYGEVNDLPPRPPSPGKRTIHIGYVSGDFHNHSVAFFFEPVLLHHNRRHLTVFAYSNDNREDDTTRRLKSTETQWRSIVGLSDVQAAEMIRRDGIDILVDLAGHSSENRLGLFALKPAPVQVSWLGYPHSTGLRQMDYYITDDSCDPPGMTEHLYTENLIRLPGSFCCYLPPARFPSVSPPPSACSGVVTFGSFNNFAKVNDQLIELWANILAKTPDSRLFLKSMALGDDETQRSILKKFHHYGIAANRIALLKVVSSSIDHLSLYSQVDIALDTFPYHGTTTTCEALWMGVPVVTLAGETHASRVGVSILTSIGCTELVAGSAEEYIGIAVSLAKTPDKLSDYRNNLRNMMAASPLMDSAALTKAVETAFSQALQQLDPGWKRSTAGNITPTHTDFAALLAEADSLLAAERYRESENAYRLLLRSFPMNVDIYDRLGTVLDRMGRFTEAVAHYEKALLLRPDFTVARFNQANTYRRMGKNENCQENLLQVVGEQPNFADAWRNLATCRVDSNMLEEAAHCLRQVLKLDPGCIESCARLGDIYQRIGNRQGEALACFNAFLELQPDFVAVINAKGNLLHELEDYAGAELCFRKALKLDPNNARTISNLGITLLAAAQPEAAAEQFNLALDLEPDNGTVMFHRGMARLLMGDYCRGWADYEARFTTIEPIHVAPLPYTRWDGSPLAGRTLLVRAEQGYGDCIQFARYLPLLASYDGRVVLECLDSKIRPLFHTLSGVDSLVIRGEHPPAADIQIPIASLPGLFNTGLTSIPLSEGYLRSGRKERELWRDTIDNEARGSALKIGIAWEGRKTRLNSNRSLPFSSLAPLFDIPGVRWYSLQTGTDICHTLNRDLHMVDLGGRIADFADTAAIIDNLDLIISIDTAVAHLAGALGAPCWLLLKASPDWRWMLERNDTPWYDSLRLFRQTKPGDWTSVVAAVADALKSGINKKS